MNGEEGSQLQKIYNAVIRSEETTKWLKANYEIQRLCCEKHEKAITQLKIQGGRVKGIFATISAAAILLTGIAILVLSKVL